MNERDSWTVDAMEQYGGSFVEILGALARRADPDNLILIKSTWPDYWLEYQAMGLEMERKENK